VVFVVFVVSKSAFLLIRLGQVGILLSERQGLRNASPEPLTVAPNYKVFRNSSNCWRSAGDRAR